MLGGGVANTNFQVIDIRLIQLKIESKIFPTGNDHATIRFIINETKPNYLEKDFILSQCINYSQKCHISSITDTPAFDHMIFTNDD